MIRQSDIDAVAKAIDPTAFLLSGQKDEDILYTQDIPAVRKRRRAARQQARAAIVTLMGRGWQDGPGFYPR